LRETTTYLNRISTAVPAHNVHDDFVIFAEPTLVNPRVRAVSRRKAGRKGIAHRCLFFNPRECAGQFSLLRMMQQVQPGGLGCGMLFGGLTAEVAGFDGL
jgi:hypothetical protein